MKLTNLVSWVVNPLPSWGMMDMYIYIYIVLFLHIYTCKYNIYIYIFVYTFFIHIYIYIHMYIYIYTTPLRSTFYSITKESIFIRFRHLTPPSTMAKFTYRRTVLSQFVCASFFLQSWDDR